MSTHIGFHEIRDFERGKPLTDEQKEHLRSCLSCRMQVEEAATRTGRATPKISGWAVFLGKVTSIFRKKKAP